MLFTGEFAGEFAEEFGSKSTGSETHAGATESCLFAIRKCRDKDTSRENASTSEPHQDMVVSM